MFLLSYYYITAYTNFIYLNKQVGIQIITLFLLFFIF